MFLGTPCIIENSSTFFYRSPDDEADNQYYVFINILEHFRYFWKCFFTIYLILYFSLMQKIYILTILLFVASVRGVFLNFSNNKSPTVDWSNVQIVLNTLFVLSCPTKLTGLYRPLRRVPLSLLCLYKPKWRGAT